MTEAKTALKAYDLPYFEPALELTKRISHSTMITPVSILAMAVRDPKVRRILTSTLYGDTNSPVTGMNSLSLLFDHLVSSVPFIGQPSYSDWKKAWTFREYSEEQINGVISIGLIDYAANFNTLFHKEDNAPSMYMLLASLKGIEPYYSKVVDYFKVTLNLSYEEMLEKVKRAEEEEPYGSALPISRDTYLHAVELAHVSVKDKEFERLYAEFHESATDFTILYKDGTETIIEKDEIETYTSDMYYVCTGLFLLDTPDGFANRAVEKWVEFEEKTPGKVLLVPQIHKNNYFNFKWKNEVKGTTWRLFEFPPYELGAIISKLDVDAKEKEKYLAKFGTRQVKARRDITKTMTSSTVEDYQGNEYPIYFADGENGRDDSERPKATDNKDTNKVTSSETNKRAVSKANTPNTEKETTKEMKKDTSKNESQDRQDGSVKTEYRIGDMVFGQEDINFLRKCPTKHWSKYKHEINVALESKYNCNLIFVGEKGSGKTTFLKRELYDRALDGHNSTSIRYGKIEFIPFNISKLESPVYRMAPEQAVGSTLSEIMKRSESTGKKAVLLCDDFDSSTQIASLVASCAREFNIPIIATASRDGFNKNLSTTASDFRVIDFNEPTYEENKENRTLFSILAVHADLLEKEMLVKIDNSLIDETLRLSSQYIKNAAFPKKAIDLLDRVASSYAWDDEYIEKMQTAYDGKTDAATLPVGELYKIVAEDYNVPTMQLSTNTWDSINELNGNLHNKIFGQDQAIEQVMKQWKLYQSGLADKNKPVGSFLFIGPSGVGKTELSKRIAEFTGRKLIRFDMSEYSESFTVSNLIGSPAGYVGYAEGGQLVHEVLAHPNCVLLLDEIEKAHEQVHNLLLQIMDTATITGNKGEKVDLHNAIVIMTSNCGAREAQSVKALGFGSKPDTTGTYEMELKRTFRPEFLGRLNAVVTFNNLEESTYHNICESQLEELNTTIMSSYRAISEVTVDEGIYEKILADANTKEAGARNIAHKIDEVVKLQLADYLLQNFETLNKLSEAKSKKLHIGVTDAGNLSFNIED